MPRSSRRIALAAVLLLAAPLMLTAQSWGLPGRWTDPVLFGGRTPWTGREMLDLAGGWQTDASRGADVAHNPLTGRDHGLILNTTDADRARIVIRYRLYSFQPDEMITFRALAGMHPGQGPMGGMDPRLYQYGGLWIYPVGLLLKISGCTLTGDIAYYLDHPEAFGRFYTVARCYSAAWGLLGVAIVFLLVARISSGWFAPALAAMLFAVLPVVVDQSHEAKPHLAGTVLMLCAALGGAVYLEAPTLRKLLAAAGLCGAAVGMVLSAYPAFLILGTVLVVRRPRAGQMLVAWLTGAFVYFAANPYVAINLFCNRGVLSSNLGNSSAMYHAAASGSGSLNAALLILNGGGALTALAGVIGAAMLARRAMQRREDRNPVAMRLRSTGLCLFAPAIVIAIQFFALAAGKPGEYGRFALYLDVVLTISAVVAVHTLVSRAAIRVSAGVLLLLTTGISGAGYLRGFIRDCGPDSSRRVAAVRLAGLNGEGKSRLLIESEPAPYCLPPVDLFAWQIELVPRGAPARAGSTTEVVVRPAEPGSPAAVLTLPVISWADKPFVMEASAGSGAAGAPQ